MRPVSVRIMHPGPGPDQGPLERWLAEVRGAVARRHATGFTAAGASDVEIVSAPPDTTSFGARLRAILPTGGEGLVVLGSGAVPLATAADRRTFVAAAGADDRRALANNRYSADVVAIARIATLPAIPDLPGDNPLPRWLESVAGYRVDDLRRRWRLGFDIDGPLDVLLLGQRDEAPVDVGRVTARLAAIREIGADPRAEVLIAGRTSATTLAWLERHTAGRVRAWVEERGLRAASRLAIAATEAPADVVRAPASVLGIVLDEAGPGALGALLARMCDAAIVDTRVLLAHRVGADETAWPSAEDRYASDLLLSERVVDPWLSELTASAAAASIPILLGGHTLVGPGMRLVIGRRGTSGPSWT
jgi:multidrug efflux pump subunit AcrA (membrane-fusion protein)